MEKDCEIYLDPEEDEVFFGCISEKEKTLYAKLANQEEAESKDDFKNEAAESSVLNVDEENNKNVLMNEQSGMFQKEIIINDSLTKINTNQSDNSVEMEHNYSTPVKPKIDKSILTTPKSIVKADKDGGFLKVLSEIALVKAEAEGDEEMSKAEDEDKENKITQQIPEIRVTEATPKKTERIILSPPRNVTKRRHQFRITYRSPNQADVQQKSHSDSEKEVKKGVNQVPNNNKRKSADLIDLNNVDKLNDMLKEIMQKTDKRFEDDLECVFLSESEKSQNEVKISTVCESPKDVKVNVPDVKSPPKIETPMPRPPPGMRFSKEARKVVEVLKKSAVDDTLNFTIPEIDVEYEENYFNSPEAPDFDKTDLFIDEAKKPVQKKFLCKTVEKECHKTTPLLTQSKVQLVKHYSERKFYQPLDGRNGIKKCVKKLPMEEKTLADVEKIKDAPLSRIPVFGVKNPKIFLNDRIPKPAPVKTTTLKTPSSKAIPKNPKFNHIESPINAYIHNKQTALVVNVKPEPKKGIFTGIPKPQTTSVKKPTQTKSQTTSIAVPEMSKLQCSSSVRLPFVEYRSATPYKIEKTPESRLPRLAPSVQKLIGTHSPRVLKHEGRFYLTSPRKAISSENSTIIADPNEVSVVVCQSAQKSNTIK